MTLEFGLWQKAKQMFTIDTDVQQVVYKIRNGQCVVRTSLAQLNFFHWASTNGILAYVRKYESSLLEAMKLDSRRGASNRPKREPERSGNKVSDEQATQTAGKTVATQPVLIFYRPCSFRV